MRDKNTGGFPVSRLIRQYMGFRRELYILVFGRMVTAMGGMVWPVLTLILTRKMGMSDSAAATVMAVAGLLMIPANLLGGWLADHWDKRKTIILCDLVSVVGYLYCALTPLTLGSAALIILAAACQNMENSPYNALIADMTRMEQRESAYSLEYMSCNLGFVIAPTMAGILFARYLWVSFLIAGLSIAVSTVMILTLIRDVHPEMQESGAGIYQQDRHGDSTVRILRDNGPVFLYLLTMAIYSASYYQYTYLMPLDLGQIHGDSGALIYGTVTSVNAVVVVLFTPVLTALLFRVRQTVKACLGYAMLMAGFILFCRMLGNIPAYYAVAVLFTCGEILTTITNGPYVADRVPASHRGRMNSMMSVFQGLTQSVVLEVSGLICGHAGHGAAWGFVIGLIGSGVVLGLLLIPLDRKKYPALYRE